MDSAIRRQSLGDILHRSAARAPHKLAVLCGGVHWTYAELDALCNRLALGLGGLGVAKGTRVAVLARNSHAFVALRFALARLGAVLVPINFMLKPEEVAYILRHAGAALLATDSGLAPVARAAAALDTSVREFVWLPSEDPSEPEPGMTTFDALAATGGGPLPQFELAPDDLAQIVYTSGTESSPKGAMLTHDAVLWQYVSCVIDASIEGSDLPLHALPLYHCAQLDVFLGPSIYVGCTNVVTAKPMPENLLPLIERHRITSFFAPPTVWIALLRSPLFDRTDLSSLQKGYYGASIMPVEVLRELAAAAAGTCDYGTSTARPRSRRSRPCSGPTSSSPSPARAAAPSLNVETRVVDDAMRDVEPGEVGEIVHRSPHLMLGYFHDDERTQGGLRGRLVPLGRPRDDRCRGLHHRRRPQEGHDQDRRRERRQPRGGGDDLPAAAGLGSCGGGRAPSEVGGGGGRRGGREAGAGARRSRSARALRHADGRRSRCPSVWSSPRHCPKNPSGKLLKRHLREAHARLFAAL